MPGEHVQALRIRELDGLRGLAALGVLLFHYTYQYELSYGFHGDAPWPFVLGKYGVHIFFMISGFVIFMTLERTRHTMDFAVSRFARLFPAYWSALLITLATITIGGLPDQAVSLRDGLVNISMLSDFFDAKEIDGSYWTLQIELFFYLQMGFWFFVGGIRRMRAVVILWLLLAVAYGALTRLDLPFSYTLREVLIIRYIPFFAAGVLFYRAHQRQDERWVSAVLLIACAIALWLIWSWREAAVVAVGSAIFTAILSGNLEMLRTDLFVYLGTISYSLYLLHQNIGYIIIAGLDSRGLAPGLDVLIATSVILLLASVLTFSLERPAMRSIRSAYNVWRAAREPAAGELS